MGAVKSLNLGIKVNGKEVEENFKSVTSQMFKLRREVSGTTEGTKEWEKANRDLAQVEKKRDGMIKKQKDFREEIKKTTSDTGDNSAAIQEFGQAFGQVTAGIMSGDLVQVQEGLRGMKNGIFAATKASLAFIATPLGMVLAGLALAIGAVTQYFRDSEEGQNAWNKIAAVTGVVVGNLTDLLSDLGGMLFKTFSEPKKTLIALKDSIIENVENRITGLIKFFPRLGEAIELALSGKFKEASLVATDAVAQIATGVENVTGKVVQNFNAAGKAVNEFGQEIKNEIKRAAELSDLEAKADKIERALIIERGAIEAKVAERRLKSREEDKYSAVQRKKFLEEAMALEKGLINKEIEAASIRASIKTEQNSFSKSSKEDLNEEATLIAAVSTLERKRADAARTLQRDLLRVDGQVNKAAGGSSKADPAIEKQRVASEKSEEEFTVFVATQRRKRQLDLMSDNEKQKALIDDKYAKQIEKFTGQADKLKELELLKQQEKDDLIAEKKKESLQRQDEIEKENKLLKDEAEFNLELEAAETDKEREELKLERARELAQEELNILKAQKLQELSINGATDAEIAAVKENFRLQGEKVNTQFAKEERKLNEDKVKWTELSEEQKLSAITGALGAAAAAFNEGSAAWKAVKISETLIATYQGAQNAYTSLAGIPIVGPALGIAAAALAVTSGLSQVRKISSTPIQKVSAPKSKGFAQGGYTDLFGTGERDSSGHEIAGVVHTNEYVVPAVLRKDPEIPPILEYLEAKRKKKLGLYADGGDASKNPLTTSVSNSSDNSVLINVMERLLIRLDQPLEAPVYFGFEAEEKRQEAEKKLKSIQERSKIKKPLNGL